MFPTPKKAILQLHESCGQQCLVPEMCDFCNGTKVPAPSSHFCTVVVPVETGAGRFHPLTKEYICSLATCGECQSPGNDSPMNMCLMHWMKNTGNILLPHRAAISHTDDTLCGRDQPPFESPERPPDNSFVFVTDNLHV